MSFRITVNWCDEYYNEHCVSSELFQGDLNDNILQADLDDAIQPVIDKWENKGYTIDCGGDDKTFELELPDWDPADSKWNQSLAQSILNDVCNACIFLNKELKHE